MSKRMLISLVIMLLFYQVVGFSQEVITHENITTDIKLFVNDSEIATDGLNLVQNNEIMIPLRLMLESIGYKVAWNETTKSIDFSYTDKNYVCQLQIINSSYGEIPICIVQCKNYPPYFANVALGPSSINGGYTLINGVTYINQRTAKYLLKELGYILKTDSTNGIIKINENINDIKLFINNSELQKDTVAIIKNNQMLISLIDVLEVLGSKVVWDESEQSIYFDYKGIKYVCCLENIDNTSPEYKRILICNIKNKGSINSSDYIRLHATSPNGVCYIINNTAYIRTTEAKYLFEALGYIVTINEDSRVININE